MTMQRPHGGEGKPAKLTLWLPVAPPTRRVFTPRFNPHARGVDNGH